MAAQAYGESGKLLSQGPIAPCYYFFGPVDILKDEAIAGLLDRALEPGLRDFNLDQRSASQLQPEDVETLCTTLPMMAERRVVIIRDVEAWNKRARAKAAVLRYAENPSPETVLILVQGSGDPDGDKELLARSTAVVFQPLEGEKARKWTARRAERLGLTLEPDAMELLLKAVEGDLGWLAAELDKLAGLGGEAAVTVAQIEGMIGVRHGETQFDWRDAVLLDRPDRAITILPHLLEQPGVSGVKLVTLLGGSLLGIGATRVAYDKGARGGRLGSAAFDVIKRVRLFGVDWKETAALWAAAAPHWPLPRVRQAVEATLAADQALKSTTISGETGILTDLVLAVAFAKREAA
jgi:DNA polymerase-3 subunit delta